MKKLYSISLVAGLAAIVVLGNAGCTSTSRNNSNVQMKSNASYQINALSEDSISIPFQQLNGINYVRIDQIVDALNLQSDWLPDTSTMRIGDNDINYVLRADSPVASKEDTDVRLSQAPIMMNGNMLIPVSAVSELLQEEMQFESKKNSLILHSTTNNRDLNSPEVTSDLDFGEDTSDTPAANSASVPNSSTVQILQTNTGLKNIDIDAMISTANRYLGVRYLFGAPPYPQSKRFDCASFTQYVYGQYGVNLVRPARAQAKQGIPVSRKNLRKGDLLFFYVPGRFKTNNIVGHNGIYIGGGKMINAVIIPGGKNGVQITDINKPYWKRVFMFAKRVAY